MQRAFGLDIPNSLDDLCDPQQMALLVYDMQAGIVSQLPDGADTTRRVCEVVEAAREGGFRVFYTRHMYLPNEVAGVSQLRTAMAWQGVRHVSDVKPHFLRDSPEFQLTAELVPSASEAIFDKITMSAFVGTPLDIVLRDCGLMPLPSLESHLKLGSSRRYATQWILDTFPSSSLTHAGRVIKWPLSVRWRAWPFSAVPYRPTSRRSSTPSARDQTLGKRRSE